MRANRAFYAMLEECRRALCGAVTEWAEAAHALRLDHLPADAQVQGLLLPVSNPPPRPIDLEAAAEAFPAALQKITEASLKRSTGQRIRRIADQLAACDAGLLRSLTDLAYQNASYRTLVTREDVFDVSSMSVLAAMAFANLLWMLDYLKRPRARPLDGGAGSRLIGRLLAQEWTGVRPGDFWFLDWTARTVAALDRAVAQKATSESPPPVALQHDLLAEYAPRFNAISPLHKLLGADHVRPQVAQKSRYTQWPGLDTLLDDPGAKAVRSVVSEELPRRLAAENAVASRAAFFRFVEALLKIDDPRLALRAQTLLAGLFWEIFEQGPEVIQRLTGQPQAAKVVWDAVSAIEAARQEDDGRWPEERRRLQEICLCLKTYPQYNALLSLQASLGSLGTAISTTVSP